MAERHASQRISIMTAVERLTKSRLPDNQSCKDCSNYKVYCRLILAGEKPFDGDSTYCFWGRAADHFNVDFLKPSQFLKDAKKRR